MKIKLSKELTNKAIEIGATHYDITLDCFLRVSDYAVCYYSEGNLTGKWVGGLIKDDAALEVDFSPPKSELLAAPDHIADAGKMVAPVAYAVFSGNGNIRIWSADPAQVETLRQQYGEALQPLYTAPQPAEQQLDKVAK